MGNINDISTLCQQIQVDDRYKSKLSEELVKSGFLEIDHYFKRVSGETAEYLFTEKIDIKNNGTKHGEVLGEGTFIINISNENSKKFEELVHTANYGASVYETLTILGCFVGGIIGISLSSTVDKPSDLNDLYMVVGSVMGSALVGGLLGLFASYHVERNGKKSIKSIREDYLPKAEFSNETFDYNLIKKVLS